MLVVVTHEAIGRYRAIAVADYAGRSEVVLSSDSFDAMVTALEHLLTKSADAVEQNISRTGCRRLTSIVVHDRTDDDDDGGSSVSSYVDELDKDGLVNSGLSLGSEVESAYESASEDDHYENDSRHFGSRSRVIRSGAQSSRHAPSKKPTNCLDASGQPRYPLRVIYTAAHGSKGNGNGFDYNVPISRSSGPAAEAWPQVPPHQQKGPNDPWPQDNGTRPSGFGFFTGGHRTYNPPPQQAPLPPPPPPGAALPMRAPPSQYFYPHVNEWAARADCQKPFVKGGYQDAASVPPPMQMPPPQGMPMRLPPLSSGPHPPGPVPSSTSQVSSSASSTPTLTSSPIKLPEYTPPPPGRTATAPATAPCLAFPGPQTQRAPYYLSPTQQQQRQQELHQLQIQQQPTPAATISYRLRIFDGSSGRVHWTLARTPPTRADIGMAATEYMAAKSAVIPVAAQKPGPRVVLMRAVFVVGGREESYDLAAYAGEDLSGLCESMAAAAAAAAPGGGGRQSGTGLASGWPLFEFVIPRAPAAPSDVLVED